MIVASPQRQIRNIQNSWHRTSESIHVGANRGFKMSYLARTAGSLALIVIICAMPGVAERAEAQASLWNNYQGSSSVQLNFVPGTAVTSTISARP